jgi:hypothetical protein
MLVLLTLKKWTTYASYYLNLSNRAWAKRHHQNPNNSEQSANQLMWQRQCAEIKISANQNDNPFEALDYGGAGSLHILKGIIYG